MGFHVSTRAMYKYHDRFEAHPILPLYLVRHDKIGSLRVKNCPVSESEWQDILVKVFEQDALPEISVTAAVLESSSISVVIRKSVQGITVSRP